nr:uncharacterized protein LOC124811306 [Hydra vulgaris]
MKKCISSPVKKLILKSVQNGNSFHKTAQLYGVGKSAVGQIIKRYELTRSPKDKNQSGRLRKTTCYQDKKLVILSKENPRLTAVDLNVQIRRFYGINCIISTIKRRLRHVNLFGRRPAKKTLVSLKKRNTRKEFASEHLKWSRQKWSKILFRDESLCCLDQMKSVHLQLLGTPLQINKMGEIKTLQ